MSTLVSLLVGLLLMVVEYRVVEPGKDLSTADFFTKLGDLFLRALPWIVGTFLLAVLAASFIRPAGRARWGRRWRWVWGLSFRSPVTTEKQWRTRAREEAKRTLDLKRQKFDEGYSKRSAEVEAQRKAARIPFWEIRQRDWYFYLYNHGHTVRDVRLTAPAEYFVKNQGSGWWPEHDQTGKQFHGHLTNKGRSEGFRFKVRWLDQNGDEKFGRVRLRQGEIEPFETPAEAYERGRVAGRAEANGEDPANLNAEQR